MNKRRKVLLMGLVLVGLGIRTLWLAIEAWRDSGIILAWTDSVALAASLCFFLLAVVALGVAAAAMRDSTSQER